jgi:4-amino-4-deoxy-L-arabinose transferase-like glycosyltransferase
MKKADILSNPYLLFFPFLIIFILWVYISPTDGTFADQGRYLWFAKNLINGFYSPPAPDINLTNGPGYPILLIPFLMLKLPLISITLMNAFFYYFSIIFLFKALKEIVSFGLAIISSLSWASYYIAYQNIPYIHTETFTYLLISILIFSIVKAFRKESPGTFGKYIILSGFIFGYIVLTKMIFGYVLLFMLAGSGLLWIFNRNNIDYRKGLVISLMALLITAPYLLYTYHMTGKIFYWGSGNDSLYWMSTPFEGEYGDWKEDLSLNPIIYGNYNIHGADSVLRAHHQEDFKEIYKYKGIERDDVYTRLAINNIKSHPLKYAQNIINNIGRLIFHYPFSYAIQRPKTLLVFPINGILLTLMLFSLVPTFINWRRFPVSIRFLLIFILLYLGGSALVSAILRMFTIAVPVILVWIAYVLQNTLKINLKFNKEL